MLFSKVKLRVLAGTAVLTIMLSLCAAALAGDDQWTPEQVGRGSTSSIALDPSGNLHVAYLGPDSRVYYAFRSADSQKWYSIAVLDSVHSVQNIYPRVAADGNGRPHMCVAMGQLMYITLDGNDKWHAQAIDSGSGTISYHCSIALDEEGSPHLSWYHEFLPGGRQFTHVRYVDKENGNWVARSVDGGISGKWNSLKLDAHGQPRLSYSQWATGGDLRYAEWDGKQWIATDVDSARNASTARGYDNNLTLGADGAPHISYFDDTKVKYAHKKDGKWVIEVAGNISSGYDYYSGSTAMLLDKQGNPHIVFGDFGGIKHLYRSGDQWHTEVLVSGSMQQYNEVDAVLGLDDKLYVSYPDPDDGYVKVVTGKLTKVAAPAKAAAAVAKADQPAAKPGDQTGTTPESVKTDGQSASREIQAAETVQK